MKAIEKFTDEQLSRILSAHANGDLVWGGSNWESECCINQAVFIERSPCKAGQIFTAAASWFDDSYQSTWSIKRFIQELSNQGFI